jgi:hypothetical protein
MFLIVVYNDPTIIYIYSLICHIKISQIMAQEFALLVPLKNFQ